MDDVNRNPKLFRAIVVMGAAMTTPGCDFFGEDCCTPKRDAAANGDTIAITDAPKQDAGVDAPDTPDDAEVDAVLIL
jgi:hypothetical protein